MSGFDGSDLKLNDTISNFRVIQNERVEMMNLNLITMEH